MSCRVRRGLGEDVLTIDAGGQSRVLFVYGEGTDVLGNLFQVEFSLATIAPPYYLPFVPGSADYVDIAVTIQVSYRNGLDTSERGAHDVFNELLLAVVLEPRDSVFGCGGADDVEVTVSIQVY